MPDGTAAVGDWVVSPVDPRSPSWPARVEPVRGRATLTVFTGLLRERGVFHLERSTRRKRQSGSTLLGGCVFRRSVTDRFGIVTAEFGSVTEHFGDVTDGRLVAA